MVSGYVQCMNYAEGLHFSAFHSFGKWCNHPCASLLIKSPKPRVNCCEVSIVEMVVDYDIHGVWGHRVSSMRVGFNPDWNPPIAGLVNASWNPDWERSHVSRVESIWFGMRIRGLV